jgi:hypothetical protein
MLYKYIAFMVKSVGKTILMFISILKMQKGTLVIIYKCCYNAHMEYVALYLNHFLYAVIIFK